MPVWVYLSGIKRSQARKEKTATSKGARSKEPGVKSQSQKKNKMRLSKPIEPEAKLPPPPPAVYGLPGLSPCPVFPSLAGYGFPLPCRGFACPPALSALGGRVFPRSAGRVFPVLGGVGFPSFSRGWGRELGFRAMCVAGVAVRSGAFPFPLILLETSQTFKSPKRKLFVLWRRGCCAFRGYSAPTAAAPHPLCFVRFALSAPSSLASARLRPLRLFRPAPSAFALCLPTLGAAKNYRRR